MMKKNLRAMFFVVGLLGIGIQAQSEFQENIEFRCTIKAYRPRLCGPNCSDIVERGPFEITYQNGDTTTIKIFEEEIEGKKVKFVFSPLGNMIIGTFDSGEVITTLNHNGETVLIYKDYSGNTSLTTSLVCE